MFRKYKEHDCQGKLKEEHEMKAGECHIESGYGEHMDCESCHYMSSSSPDVCYQSTSSHFGTCHSCGFYYNSGTLSILQMIHTSDDALSRLLWCWTVCIYIYLVAPSASYDCISCEKGYEIDVIFDDCTGFCVPEGTATRPISHDTCNYPCAHCGFPLHDQTDETTCRDDLKHYTHTNGCFKGDDRHGHCVRCGFSTLATDNANDCVSCDRGYEIDVVYGDCTGYCVPAGTAKHPLIDSDCKMPLAACGESYDAWLHASPLSGRGDMSYYEASFGICPVKHQTASH